KLIDKLIKILPVIVYVDSYYLWKVSHYPHFITVIKNQKIAIKSLIFGMEKSNKLALLCYRNQ
ncbi:MAG: hypothetical protein QXU71_03250, partial [Candidatus Aenigmatarchaeota archaeon]